MIRDFLAHPPDPARIHSLLKRYVRVRIEAEKDQLAEGDRRALAKLIEAARWVDPIYWRQRSEIGWELAKAVKALPDFTGGELDRLLSVNFGPWDSLDGDSPFWGDFELPLGGNFYPPDLGRAELNEYIERHPEERQELLEETTLVRRLGDRLVAEPYEQAYTRELDEIASAMQQASRTVTDDAFRRYLLSRAEGLRSGDLFESEKLWVGVSQSPIDVVIGPYEVYDDALRGVKLSYQAAVLVRHPLSSRVEEFERNAPELGRELPGAVAEDPVERNVRIGVFDLEYASGMLNMGSKAIAATLPNDERVRREAGTRLLLFRNVIEAKFDSILKPLAGRLLPAEELRLVTKDAFLFQTLLHEAGHAVSSGFVDRGGRRTGTTIKEALGERYSTIEECRADLLGLYFLSRLVRNGAFPRALEPAAATTFVAHSVRAVRFGDKSDHARAAAIALSALCRGGAVRRDGDHLRIDPIEAHRTVAKLAAEVQSIANRGDYEAAGHLIDDHGTTPPEIAALLVRTEDMPIDLEFDFGDSVGLLG
jgi:hypothetical protein